jgi:hypothetical protein
MTQTTGGTSNKQFNSSAYTTLSLRPKLTVVYK